MVWPVRARHSLKVSISSGAEPAMNSRMWRAGLARQRRLGEHAHVQRRHAHEHRGLGQARDHGAGVELREPDHLAAVEQRAVRGDEQAVHMEDRQRVDQHVAGAPAPVVLQHLRIRQQVAVASASRPCCGRWCRWCRGWPPGRRRRVRRRLVPVAVMRRALEQAAAAVVVQREDVAACRP